MTRLARTGCEISVSNRSFFLRIPFRIVDIAFWTSSAVDTEPDVMADRAFQSAH